MTQLRVKHSYELALKFTALKFTNIECQHKPPSRRRPDQTIISDGQIFPQSHIIITPRITTNPKSNLIYQFRIINYYEPTYSRTLGI